ncbi:DUF1382 family protein [Pseudomonas syringae]|uniref:DUF1382 family protein n=1 Tax=Pseudomonas syringae TaxID=317 RepID=UPI0021AC81E4|nr:DUF1382 family protein [Pseudomonas syringae]
MGKNDTLLSALDENFGCSTMNRANPAQLRQALETAHLLAKAGIRFVCMPVVDEADGMNLNSQDQQRLERMALIAESAERLA